MYDAYDILSISNCTMACYDILNWKFEDLDDLFAHVFYVSFNPKKKDYL